MIEIIDQSETFEIHLDGRYAGDAPSLLEAYKIAQQIAATRGIKKATVIWQ